MIWTQHDRKPMNTESNVKQTEEERTPKKEQNAMKKTMQNTISNRYDDHDTNTQKAYNNSEPFL